MRPYMIPLLLIALAARADPKPNVVFVLADQWRAQATGYAGDPNLQGKTPVLDRLAAEGVNFRNAVSCTPVYTPYRASLLTRQYPLRHGLFLNDAPRGTNAVSIAPPSAPPASTPLIASGTSDDCQIIRAKEECAGQSNVMS